MLSDNAFRLIGERFIAKPFAVPGPGAGVEAVRHAEAMHEIAKELAKAGHAAEALEAQAYSQRCHEMAVEWYSLQGLVLMVFEAGINRGKREPADGKKADGEKTAV